MYYRYIIFETISWFVTVIKPSVSGYRHYSVNMYRYNFGEDWLQIFSFSKPGLRIRIRIGSGFNRFSDPDPDPDSESGSGSRRAKMTHKSRKNLKVLVLKCWMASFEICGLLL
jgi:hypothetical protein